MVSKWEIRHKKYIDPFTYKYAVTFKLEASSFDKPEYAVVNIIVKYERGKWVIDQIMINKKDLFLIT